MTPLPETSSKPDTVGLDSSWWACGLALHERAAGQVRARTAGGLADDRARRRLTRWRAGYGPMAAFPFERRLADCGLDEAALLALLAEPPADLAARIPRPGWVDAVEQAVRTAAPLAPGEPLPADWRQAFAVPLRSFVAGAVVRLVEQAPSALASRHADIQAIATGFAVRLSQRLTRIAVRTLAHELNEHRARGLLRGGDSRELLADFVRRQTTPAGLAGLVTRYPVLARLLGQAGQFATDAMLELLSRFTQDRQSIVDRLCGRADPGRLVAVEVGLGDTHRHGRSVAVLRFAGGWRAVYKPRDMAAHDRFGAMVEWLNGAAPGLGLRTAAVVVRPGYGWQEFIPAAPLADSDAADRFYRRQGALLALLYALQAGDIHYQNVIACGDQPVLVDLETLFQPVLPVTGAAADPARNALAASVQRTGLLPMVAVGENGPVDVSGIGADEGQVSARDVVDWELTETGGMRLTRRTVEFEGAGNRPRLGGKAIDPSDHQTALLEGFRLCYDAITRRRAEFTTLLDDCANLEVRTVIRPTQGYATLLDESTQADLLGDALDRDHALDLLWTESAHLALCWQVARYELADLWAGDVPIFCCRPGSTDLWTSDGQRLPELLDRPSLASTRKTVAAMGVADRRDQEWIISAAMACRRASSEHLSTAPMSGELTPAAATVERLLAAACALADQIVARSVADDDRINWLSVELVEDKRWMLQPMGAGLADGYVGVALFLAELSRLTGIARYASIAQRAISAVPQLYATLAVHPDLVDAIGCGGLDGFGGMAYALARMASLLADDRIRSWALTAVELAATAASTPGPPGLATGVAGCLAAMTAVRTELASDEAGRLAADCADRLAELALRTDGWCTTDEPAMPTGFANGTAGIGWSLARYAVVTGQPRYAEAARLVLGVALAGDRDGDPGPGWCSGMAGRAMARLALTEDLMGDDTGERLLRQLTNRPVLRDLSLCHGELGIADAITALALAGPLGSAAGPRRRRSGLILGAISRSGPAYGALDGIPTPGLLTGTAGVGYGLLRLGFAERVPSVLLLEPSGTR